MRPIEMRGWDRGAWLDFIIELFRVITPGVGKEAVQDSEYKVLPTQVAYTEWGLNKRRVFAQPARLPTTSMSDILDTVVTLSRRHPTREDILAWIKATLVEMPECNREPHFIRMGSECLPKEFAYLEERVGNYFALRKRHMAHQAGDTFRDFIAQVETLD